MTPLVRHTNIEPIGHSHPSPSIPRCTTCYYVVYHIIMPPYNSPTSNTNASRHIWHHSHLTYPIPAHPCHRMHTSVPCRHPYVHIRKISSKPRSLQPPSSHLPLTPPHAVTAITDTHATLSFTQPLPQPPPPCNHPRSTPETTRLLGTLQQPAAYASVASIGHHHAPSTLHPLFLTLNRP